MIEKAQEVIDEVEANLEFTPVSDKERYTPEEQITVPVNTITQRHNTEQILVSSGNSSFDRHKSLRISDQMEGGEPEDAIVELRKTETLETARSTRRLIPQDGAKDDKEEYVDTRALKRQ